MSSRLAVPLPLLVGAAFVSLEGAGLVVYAGLEAAAVSAGRAVMGVTTSIFFAAYGSGLLVAAWGLTRRHSWARSPVVFAQLVQLGLAWNFWGGSTGWVAGLLAAVAVVVLVAVMMPASTAALAPDD